jgi:hypothetical protein
MEGFFDSDKFLFKLDEDSGHLMPVHHRELGEKNDNLYSPRVKWSDVALNGVPLEKTFEYEDDIVLIQGERSETCEEQKYIMVNSRVSQSQSLPHVEEVEDKHWVKRLERLYPMNYQEAKKKRKSVERYPVKPKGKKAVRDEKIYSSADKFHEITDENSGGEISLENTIYIQKKDDYKIIKEELMRTPGDPFWPPQYNIIKVPIRTKYCPPLHWLKPEVQWEKIWTHVDELKTGKKRDYHYYPDDCGYGPCIYFYDKDSGDLNYDFDWSRDFMDIQQYFGDYIDYNDYY